MRFNSPEGKPRFGFTVKTIEEFYNDFVLASHCEKDRKMFIKKFKEYFKI